jgi:hypothetical protein
MKFISTIFTFALLLISTQAGFSQGFVNLDFESAKVIPLTTGGFFPPYSVATTNAVPGWSVYYGSSQQSQITYNDPALGSTFTWLVATNGLQISGNFSVQLQGGGTFPSASISQTGLVPNGTASLQFEAQSSLAAIPGSLLVSLGGQNIPFFALSTGPNYTLFGGDVSAFAGQIAQLTFSALQGGANNWTLDNIQFSPSAVPEPSTLALGALVTLLLGFRRFSKLAT